MKTRIFLAQLALLAMCVSVGVADDKAESKKNFFKEYSEKFGQAGPEHKFLEPLAGEFDAKVRMWMDPAEAPKVSEGKVIRRCIFEGRYVVGEFMGEMMDHPFKGIGVMGYDRAQKKWVSIWIDNVSTGIPECAGSYDESNKTWTFKREFKCPITGKQVKMRDTLHIVSDSEEQMEMFKQFGEEKEMKVMEITLKKKKQATGQ